MDSTTNVRPSPRSISRAFQGWSGLWSQSSRVSEAGAAMRPWGRWNRVRTVGTRSLGCRLRWELECVPTVLSPEWDVSNFSLTSLSPQEKRMLLTKSLTCAGVLPLRGTMTTRSRVNSLGRGMRWSNCRRGNAAMARRGTMLAPRPSATGDEHG